MIIQKVVRAEVHRKFTSGYFPSDKVFSKKLRILERYLVKNRGIDVTIYLVEFLHTTRESDTGTSRSEKLSLLFSSCNVREKRTQRIFSFFDVVSKVDVKPKAPRSASETFLGMS
jgi:hypothetical protein